VLDATTLEKRGIHTVTVAWDTFENAARTQARLQGVPDLEVIVVPHRAGGQTEEDQRRKAEAAFDELLARLTGSSVPSI
jgi:phosphoglycerate dehydrogenase-like enzyme